ncbi:MAG: Na(+)/H(+) antiporter subunit B [Spirochaetaceae bacterium]
MIELVVVTAMGVFAVLAIHSRLLRNAVVYLAIFSLMAAFLFLLHAAPELAIAEAVMGSGLVTLLYLTALKRYQVFTIAVVTDSPDSIHDRLISRVQRSDALQEIRNFLAKREREAQIVFVRDTRDEALKNPGYDLVLEVDGSTLVIFGSQDDYLFVELELMFGMRELGSDMGVRFEWIEAEVQS